MPLIPTIQTNPVEALAGDWMNPPCGRVDYGYRLKDLWTNPTHSKYPGFPLGEIRTWSCSLMFKRAPVQGSTGPTCDKLYERSCTGG